VVIQRLPSRIEGGGEAEFMYRPTLRSPTIAAKFPAATRYALAGAYMAMPSPRALPALAKRWVASHRACKTALLPALPFSQHSCLMRLPCANIPRPQLARDPLSRLAGDMSIYLISIGYNYFRANGTGLARLLL
jgi:hypothetical protein